LFNPSARALGLSDYLISIVLLFIGNLSLIFVFNWSVVAIEYRLVSKRFRAVSKTHSADYGARLTSSSEQALKAIKVAF